HDWPPGKSSHHRPLAAAGPRTMGSRRPPAWPNNSRAFREGPHTRGNSGVSIGRNTAVGLATNAVVLGLGIVLSVVLTRSLGAEQRGIYVLLVTTNVLLTHLIDLSMEVACSTLLARGRYRLAEINTVAAILALVLGIIGLGAVSIAFLFLSD